MRARSPATAGLMWPAPASLYRLAGFTTGGMPGTVWMADAAVAASGAMQRPASRAMRGKRLRGVMIGFAVGMGKASAALSPGRVAADRRDRARHDRIDAELAQRGAGTARIAAVDAVGGAGLRCVAQAGQPHHLRRHRQLQRGVGQARVGTDLVVANAVLAQDLRIAGGAGCVIFRRRERTRRL